MYSQDMLASIKKVEATRASRIGVEPRRMSAEEKDALLKEFHPDYRDVGFDTLRVGVNKGDKVRVGTLLGKAGGFVSANIHSSVSGTVTKVDQITDASGFKKPAIFIKVEGDEWEEYIDQTDTLITETDLDAKQIIDRIAEMGIVGMGGATFPTHVKLSPPPGQSADYVIINAVECEPYLTSDDALMRVKAMEIMVGCAIIMKAANDPRTLIGIEVNKPDAIRIMRDAAERAKERLLHKQSIMQYYHSQAALNRAMNRLKISKRHNHEI